MKDERQNRIDELESLGKFDEDVEDDPPSKVLRADDIDYLGEGIIKKIKTKIAFFLAYRFADKAERKKELIIKEIVGAQNLRTDSGVILTANHFSPIDSFIMHRTFDRSKRRGRFYRIIKEGNYTSFPGFFGFLMRNCNTLPLSSDPAAMRKFLKAVDTLLKRGECILVYPEQSMWYNYKKPKPLKSGAFDLAVRSGVPVVPVFITMKESEFTGKDGEAVMEHTVHVGDAIYPDESLPRKERAEKMLKENFEYNRKVYEKVYGVKLEYLNKTEL